MVESNWQDLVSDMVGDAKPPKYLIQSLMDETYRPLILEAAKKRGMPVSHYYRRAVLAFVAYDLDIDFLELARFEPAIPESPRLPPRRFEGRGFGPWRIQRLER